MIVKKCHSLIRQNTFFVVIYIFSLALFFVTVLTLSKLTPQLLATADRMQPEHYYRMSKKAFRDGDTERGMNYLRQATIEMERRDPKNISPRYHIALSARLMSENKPKEAIQLLERLVRLGVKSPFLYHALGARYWQVGEQDSAVKNMEKAFEIAPHLTMVRTRLAWYYIKLGEPEAAEKLVEGIPEDAEYRPHDWLYLARISERLGRVQDAVRYANRYLKVEPANKEALSIVERCKRKD